MKNKVHLHLMKGRRMRPTGCPWCLHVLDGHTAGATGFRPGNISICAECGMPAVVTADYHFAKIEANGLPQELAETIAKIQANWEEFHGRKVGSR